MACHLVNVFLTRVKVTMKRTTLECFSVTQ
jgi:hypothetical protein